MKRTLITNIGMLATPQGTAARGGRAQGEICILKNAWILIENDLIAQVGTGAAPAAADAQTINAGGKLVTPGLVDAHTHLIFGGWRQNELALKLHGAGYLDILAAGGGILSTMRATQSASEEQLEAKASAALDEMLRFGTTTAEAKSGYGLSTEEECKALRVIGKLHKHHVMDLAATFMGAHAVPEAYRDNRQGYLELLCEEMLPAVREQGIAEFCDVFCEKGVFSAEESRRILLTGRQHGLRPKIHADEIEAIGGSELAGEIGAVSAEHLIVCPPSGIASMARGGTVACCLPVPQYAAGHQPRLPALPADARAGADRGDAQRRRRHLPRRPHRLHRAGQAGGHSHLERRGSGLYLLPPWQQSGRYCNQKRKRRLDKRTGNAHPDIACSARKLGFYAKSSLP